jgi:hypothetical protein
MDRDSDDILQAVIRGGQSNENEGMVSNTLINTPSHVSPDSLMGKMPKPEKILKKGVLCKLSSAQEWKPMQVILTSVGLFLARPDENLLRDLIPLYEIAGVKRVSGRPNSRNGKKSDTEMWYESNPSMPKFSKLTENEHSSQPMIDAIQIRTVADGYNSGRIYYLRVEADEDCQSWTQSIRSAANRAVILKHAGPGFFRKAQYQLAEFYHSTPVQIIVAALIFFSFLSNVLQTEMVADMPDNEGLSVSPSDTYQASFSILETFFTFAFAVELLMNILSHFILPFLKVPAQLITAH